MYIYVSGRGHSGSTVLDVLLGNSKSVVSVGELASGLGRMQTGGTCSCGYTTDDCQFWAKVRTRFARLTDRSWEDAAESVYRFAHIRNIRHALFGGRRHRVPTKPMADVVDDIRTLQQAITEVSARPHLLDSSKEITLAITLLRFRSSTRVIHLVRNPVAVVGSHYWRFRSWGGYFKFLRRVYRAPFLSLPFMAVASTSWLVGNSLCELMHLIDRRRVFRLRYEDLCERPQQTLEELGDWLNIDLADVAAKVERNGNLRIGHNIGGNHVRHAGSIVFDSRRAPRQAPRWVSILTMAICGPLMKLYGYPFISRAKTARPSLRRGTNRSIVRFPQDAPIAIDSQNAHGP